jgi:hypothetical protein
MFLIYFPKTHIQKLNASYIQSNAVYICIHTQFVKLSIQGQGEDRKRNKLGNVLIA